MSNIPSFKISSKPAITAEEFSANKRDSGKFIQDPGTYSMIIKSIDFADKTDDKDSAWVSTTITLEHTGKTLRYFLSVPTECRNGFLYGDKKDVWPYEKVAKFFSGLGLTLDFDNAMSQIGAVFGNPDSLIGKSLNVRLGYSGPHVKYNGKEDYSIVEKDHVTVKIAGSYATPDAATAAAANEGLKLNKNAGFINVQEIFAAKEAQIDLEATEDSTDDNLPF